MYEVLKKELHNLNLVCRLQLKSQDIDKLNDTEAKVLFNCRDLSEELADSVFELATIFYKHKILPKVD